MSGRPWEPAVERAVDGPEAVLEQGAGLCRYGGQPVRLRFSGRDGGRLEERDPFVEDGGISGRFHVLGDRVREPEEVVRAVRPDPPAARGVPPVLNVALQELARRGPEEMRAGEVGAREHQRHDVLELVAESVRPARLVVAGARPEAAGEVLVEEPPVHQQVEGVVGGRHAHGPERLVPERLHGGELGLCRDDAAGAAVAPKERAGLVQVAPLSDEEDEAPRLAGQEVHGHLQGRAGVEAGAEAAREPRAPERGRASQRAIPAQELPAVTGGREKRLAGARERDAAAEDLVVGIARQDRARVAVALGHDEARHARFRGSERPLVVCEEVEATGPIRSVRQGEERQLDRLVPRHEDGQLLRDAVRGTAPSASRRARGAPPSAASAASA